MSELVLMYVTCAEAIVAAKARRMKSLIRMMRHFTTETQRAQRGFLCVLLCRRGETLYDPDMRALAHQTVDALFDHVEDIAGRRVVDWQTADELRARVRIDDRGGAEAMPLIRQLMENAIQLHHPAYMGHQVCPPFPTAVIADLVISTLNQSTAVFEMSPIGTVIEQEVVRWLADRAGYPADALGTAVSGGSAANLTALLAARARWNDSGRAAKRPVDPLLRRRALLDRARGVDHGHRCDDVIKVPTDDQHRLDLDALDSRASRRGRRHGHRGHLRLDRHRRVRRSSRHRRVARPARHLAARRRRARRLGAAQRAAAASRRRSRSRRLARLGSAQDALDAALPRRDPRARRRTGCAARSKPMRRISSTPSAPATTSAR